MGQFSYVCSKCGGHGQFDWMTECVVKIGQVYVKGENIKRKGGDTRHDIAMLTRFWHFSSYFQESTMDMVRLMSLLKLMPLSLLSFAITALQRSLHSKLTMI